MLTKHPHRSTVALLALLALALIPLPGRGEATNRIGNASFEAGFRHWLAQEGKLEWLNDARQAHTGTRALRISAAPVGKQFSGRLYCARRVEIVPGARYVLSAWVKGQGQVTLGVYEYAMAEGSAKFRQRIAMPTGLPLTSEWQQVTFAYRPADESVVGSSFYAQVVGEKGQMLLDDVSLAACPEPTTTLSFGLLPAMAPAGTSLQLPLSIESPVAQPQLAIALRSEEGTLLARPQHAAGRLDLALPAQLNGCTILSAVERTSGALASGYIDVCPPPIHQACLDAAARMKLPPASHLVFVGDSLTAFYQGHNYVDKVRWALQSRLGAGLRVTNAGIGGDTITRVKDRLERDVLALSPRPTHVFLFLGHNDSKLKSPDYRDPYVAAADFEAHYREVVQTIQSRLGAKVFIISSTSSVYEITQASAAKSAEAKKPHTLFGKPEVLQQFNAIAHKVAQDLNADYLDMYEPFRAHADKPSLFTPDGVHINEQGNRLVALEILKFLGR